MKANEKFLVLVFAIIIFVSGFLSAVGIMMIPESHDITYSTSKIYCDNETMNTLRNLTLLEEELKGLNMNISIHFDIMNINFQDRDWRNYSIHVLRARDIFILFGDIYTRYEYLWVSNVEKVRSWISDDRVHGWMDKYISYGDKIDYSMRLSEEMIK